MTKVQTKRQVPLPCRLCGAPPRLRRVDVHFRPSDDFLFTETQVKCSNPKCDKEHRHFAPRATRREAIVAWNARNCGEEKSDG